VKEPAEEKQLRSAAQQDTTAPQPPIHQTEEALPTKIDELAHSLSLMRATLESTTDGIMVGDEQGRVTDYNEKALQILGINRELLPFERQAELRATVTRQLKDPEKFMARVQDIYTTWPPETFDVLEMLDGRIIERYSKIQRIGERNVGRVWSFRDITERRKTEAALKASHAQFSTVINQSPVGIYLLDHQLRFRHINPKALPVFGGLTDLIGRDWVEVIHILWPKEAADGLVQQFRHTLKTGESYFGVGFSSDRADRPGKEYYDWEIHRVTLPEGEHGIVVYFTDVSAHVLAQEALRESEARLRAAFNQAAVGMAQAELNGKFEQVNQRMADILGYTPEELCQRTFMDITHPDDRAATSAKVRQLLAGEIPDYALEKRYLCKDGRMVWSRTTVTLLKDASGQPRRFIGVVEDITERKQAEESIRESAARLDLALAAGKLGNWSWNVENDIVTFSPRGCEIFGLPPKTPVTWTQVREYLHKDDRERARLAVEQALATKTDYSVEYRVNRPSGERCWVLATGQGVYDRNGRVTSMIGVVQDITERKNVEEALREEYIVTEQLNDVARAIATELDVGKIVQLITDAGTRITRAQFGAFFYNVLDEKGGSYMLYALSGVPREAFSKFPMPRATGLFGPTFRGEGVIRLDDVRKDSRFGHNAPYHGMPAGHLPVVSYLAVPVISRSGKVLGGLFFGHSEPGIFTTRDEKIIIGVAAQAAAAMDTAQAYQAEQVARAAAEQANLAKDHFLAALSHELRTPLTPVLALLSNLCDDASLPPAVLHDLETMRRNVELEARLIDDLLDLTRVSRGKLELHPARVSIGQVIEDAIETCQVELKARRLTLTREIANPQQTILVDGARITQILWNLLKNAIKFTPEGGHITVRAELGSYDDGQLLTIEVQDNGKGIDPEHLQRLFKAFEQGDRQITRQFGGLGLGLAISRAIAESHHGTLIAKSPGLGHGSTFTLSLPLAVVSKSEPTSPKDAPGKPAGVPSSPPSSTNRPLRILLVEDHPDTAKSLSVLLQRRGYLVSIADRVATALATAAKEPFDVLISDLGLPDGTGYDVIASLRQQRSFPAIALSGYGMEDDLRKCQEAGFSEHLVKPVRMAQLEEALARVLSRPSK
jgi:PAS domain S-box-containing protein